MYSGVSLAELAVKLSFPVWTVDACLHVSQCMKFKDCVCVCVCPVCHVIDNSHCVCVCVCLSVVWYVDEVVIDTHTPACTHTRTHRLSKYKESCIRHQLLLALWSHPILRHLANLSSKTQGKTKGGRFVSSLFPFFFVSAVSLWLYVGTRFNFKEDVKSLPVNFPHANGHVSRLAFTVRIKLAVKMKIFLISYSVTGI